MSLRVKEIISDRKVFLLKSKSVCVGSLAGPFLMNTSISPLEVRLTDDIKIVHFSQVSL